MRALLPPKCPVPERCRTRSTRHWSADARDTCSYHQQEERFDLEFNALNLPFARGSRKHIDYLEQQEARTLVVATHVPVQPTHPTDIVLTRNAERQLLGLSPGYLTVIGLMLARDIYRINQLLRAGDSLAGGAGPIIDYHGYASMQEFVDDIAEVFTDLGSEMLLDEEVILYRGIGLPQNAGYTYPDVAGIGKHIATGSPLTNEFSDAGFSFATIDPNVALTYDGTASGSYTSTQRVLLELKVHSGICIPHKDHRSAKLAGHTHGVPLLATGVEQVIFAQGTKWKVESIDLDSSHGVPLVRMSQALFAR